MHINEGESKPLLFRAIFLFFIYPPSHRPHVDPTSTLHRPYTDPTSTLHRPYIDPTSTLHRPHIDLTSTTHRTPYRPYIDLTSTLHRPHIDLTSTLYRPYMDPTLTPHWPHIGRPHTDPTPTPCHRRLFLAHHELTNENVSCFPINQSKTKTFIVLEITRKPVRPVKSLKE